MRFLVCHWKDIFKISPNLKPNCYGLATRCRKSYFSFVGCRKPKKVTTALDTLQHTVEYSGWWQVMLSGKRRSWLQC